MKKNIGDKERVVRVVAGLGIVSLYLVGSPDTVGPIGNCAGADRADRLVPTLYPAGNQYL